MTSLVSPPTASVQPAVVSRVVAAVLSGVVVLAVLGAAGWLVRDWARTVDAVPLSWQRPAASGVLVLPGAAVVGLLLGALVVDGGHRGSSGRQLVATASRAALLWAATGALWLGLSVVGLYDGLGAALAAGNVVEVVLETPAASRQLAAVGVALLVRVLLARLESRLEVVAVLALVAAGVLGTLPFLDAAGHGHGAIASAASLPALAAVQAVALVGWLGTLVALALLRGATLRRRAAILRLGTLAATLVLVAAGTAVVAGMLRPTSATPPSMAGLQLAAVAVVVVVGHRHRGRVADLASLSTGRPAPLLVLLVAGEVAVGTAALLVACWAPVGA